MRSEASSNNAQFNRKSIISSQSTGSSNNEVRINILEENNQINLIDFLSILRQLVVLRLQPIKTIKLRTLRMLHRNKQHSSHCRATIARPWAAIRTYLWKLMNIKSISVNGMFYMHLNWTYKQNFIAILFRFIWHGMYVTIVRHPTNKSGLRQRWSELWW